MKTSNTTQILLKSIDLELKKQLQKDLQAYRITQLNKQGINQGNKQAAWSYNIYPNKPKRVFANARTLFGLRPINPM